MYEEEKKEELSQGKETENITEKVVETPPETIQKIVEPKTTKKAKKEPQQVPTNKVRVRWKSTGEVKLLNATLAKKWEHAGLVTVINI